MNIVSMAAQYLTPMIVDKIASSLGITSPLAQKAIAAILPTILAGLMGSSSKPEGLGALTKALGQQDTGILGNLGSLIGGAGQAGLIDGGSKVLGSLLGNAGVGSMTNAVAKFAGVGEAPTKSLIGMLAPIALGTLAKQQKADKLDAAGLAKLLAGQKDNIAAAMPAGFSDLLKGTGLLDSLGSAAKSVAAASPTPAARPPVHEAPRPAPGSANWLPWAAALALLAFGGWYFLGGGGRQVHLPTPPRVLVGQQDVAGQLGSVIEGLRGTLVGVRDEQSAKAAVPRLQDMAKQLDGINSLRGQLPADGKKSLASYVGQLLPIVRPLIENALKAAGVGPVAKPILDQILNRLETMSKA